MPNITVSRATTADIPRLIDARIEFLEALGFTGDRQALIPELSDYFSKSITDNSCIACFASVDEDPAGCGILVIREQPGNFKNYSSRMGYFMNMYTVPAFRRKGICSALLDTLMNEARKLGVHAFELLSTTAGEPVYRKMGFNLHAEPMYRKYE